MGGGVGGGGGAGAGNEFGFALFIEDGGWGVGNALVSEVLDASLLLSLMGDHCEVRFSRMARRKFAVIFPLHCVDSCVS